MERYRMTMYGPQAEADGEWVRFAAHQQAVEGLTKERDEALGALGYPVPSDTPSGRLQCGLCGPREATIATLTQQLAQANDQCARWKESAEAHEEDHLIIASLKEQLAQAQAELNTYKDHVLRVEGFNKILAQERNAAQSERDEARAIIKQHNLCHDLHGKVGQKEFEEGCARETIKEYGSCSWQADLTRLRATLQSIADNTCCGSCQEAALVAKAALATQDAGTAAAGGK